jgi:hypothetical protein
MTDWTLGARTHKGSRLRWLLSYTSTAYDGATPISPVSSISRISRPIWGSSTIRAKTYSKRGRFSYLTTLILTKMALCVLPGLRAGRRKDKCTVIEADRRWQRVTSQHRLTRRSGLG